MQSSSGNFRLSWSAGEESGVTYILETSPDSTFTNAEILYRGPDQAKFISGLPDGRYYYRIKVEGAAWSPPLSVEVQHHSLRLALILSTCGLIIFAGVVAVIYRGSKTTGD